MTTYKPMTVEERMVSHAKATIMGARTSNVKDVPICEELVYTIGNDEKFSIIPSSTGKHHYYPHGNLVHTSEVVASAMEMCRTANAYRRMRDLPEVDEVVVFLAALLHDYGKIYAYENVSGSTFAYTKTKDYTIQLHIQESIEKATKLLKNRIDSVSFDKIIHAIGAHHGKIEWGALWLPNSPEAWAVHLADMTSVFVIHDRKDK